MRLYGLFFALTACASAGQPGEAADAAVIDVLPKDGPIEQPDAPMMNTCPGTDTCATAMMITPSISGDTGNAKVMKSGYQSAWFRVRVTEDESGSIGLTLRVASKLTFPPNGFETFVYVNAGSDVAAECSITTGTRTTTGNLQTVKAEWGEGIIPNGSSDSRNVTIEVRPVAGNTSCSSAQMWQLEIEGNWL